MGNNIYVGNLPFNVDSQEVEELFVPYGSVTSVNLITDRETGRLRGFGFVEMGTDEEAGAAIEALNGTDLKGRTLTVNEARPRGERGGDRGGRGGGGGGGFGGGRDRY
ncbi:MAG: RNA-binding protein [Candidatus Tectomicrobia bacterium]|nr:RNA-binding protein [Candidatus Tectomicrobia bacterium]